MIAFFSDVSYIPTLFMTIYSNNSSKNIATAMICWCYDYYMVQEKRDTLNMVEIIGPDKRQTTTTPNNLLLIRSSCMLSFTQIRNIIQSRDT